MDLITLTGTAITSASSLLELAKNIKHAELQHQIAELNIQLATIQNETASLIRENGALKKELDYTKNDKVNPLVFNPKDGLYYDSESDIPFCPNCYEGEKKERRHLKAGFKECPNCHEVFQDKPIVAAVAHRNNYWQ